jgi:hypothetical protein
LYWNVTHNYENMTGSEMFNPLPQYEFSGRKLFGWDYKYQDPLHLGRIPLLVPTNEMSVWVMFAVSTSELLEVHRVYPFHCLFFQWPEE